MAFTSFRRMTARSGAATAPLLLAAALAVAGCSGASSTTATAPTPNMSTSAPTPDPRVGLKAGVRDAGQATWNMHLLSASAPAAGFENGIMSDLTFTGNTVIQGSFHGYQFWDISNPSAPVLKEAFVCPASQSDVSVYKNLLFVSGEGLEGRLDCGTDAPHDTVSKERLRGLRIFDITDMAHPRNVGNVQTCRGSHTHTVLVDPNDTANVYVYISGSAPVRSPNELPGCVASPTDSNSALFRIEVIKVPVAHPEQAAIVNSPRIFNDLVAPPRHGDTPAEQAAHQRMIDSAKAAGAFIANVEGREQVAPPQFVQPLLDSIVHARGGTPPVTHADSVALHAAFQGIVDRYVAAQGAAGPRSGPTQCHDITVYPAIGLAGGACAGYGLLLDIHDPASPRRIAAVADSNFSYWHSATFNNDGTKILFSDEWGGGTQPKCRSTDPKEWGADAIFTIDAQKQLHFQSYYKMPAPQTATENCVAHNGSLIPIPGRDVMVQSWYQGGVSVFDWTDAAHPREIAYFDRGPLDANRLELGGTWSAYWYNGNIVSSEIARGLDILELTPSAFISPAELAAAKTVHMDYLNTQGQPRFTWPASFSLARAYVDQLQRSHGLSAHDLDEVREDLGDAEKAAGDARRSKLNEVASRLQGAMAGSSDAAKVRLAMDAVRALAQ